MIKNKHNKIVTSNHIITASLVWLIVWLVIIIRSDLADYLSSYFATAGQGNSSGEGMAVAVVRIPLIIGSFALAYGMSMKTEDKWGTIIITALLGALFAYVISVPILGITYFTFNYTW